MNEAEAERQRREAQVEAHRKEARTWLAVHEYNRAIDCLNKVYPRKNALPLCSADTDDFNMPSERN